MASLEGSLLPYETQNKAKSHLDARKKPVYIFPHFPPNAVAILLIHF